MSGDPQSYDTLAHHYEHLTGEHEDIVGEWLPSVLPERRTTAVDLGCGAGRHAMLLADYFDHVVAFDVSAAMIDLAGRTRPNPKVEYAVRDVFDVRGAYDFVFSSAMLHHVRDLTAALSHIKTLVAPGGRAALVDVTAPSNPLYRAAISLAPKTYYRLGAVRSLLPGLLRRHRSAWRRYRLETSRPWLDHLATDRFLTPRDFDATYAGAFPDATFERVGFTRACVWDADALSACGPAEDVALAGEERSAGEDTQVPGRQLEGGERG